MQEDGREACLHAQQLANGRVRRLRSEERGQAGAAPEVVSEQPIHMKGDRVGEGEGPRLLQPQHRDGSDRLGALRVPTWEPKP